MIGLTPLPQYRLFPRHILAYLELVLGPASSAGAAVIDDLIEIHMPAWLSTE